MESERLRKERDDLLWAIEGLHMERADAQQRIDLLKCELEGEKDLKVEAEGVSVRLARKVDQCQEEVRHLEAKVTRHRDEVRKLRTYVDCKPPVSLVVFLPEIHGRTFDTVGM